MTVSTWYTNSPLVYYCLSTNNSSPIDNLGYSIFGALNGGYQTLNYGKNFTIASNTTVYALMVCNAGFCYVSQPPSTYGKSYMEAYRIA